MKQIFLLFILAVSMLFANSQVPEAFSYQAVVRNASGEVIPNQLVSFRISILTGSGSGPTAYSETHLVTTNNFGLANLTIGSGDNQTGIFSPGGWGLDAHFIKIEVDPTGGSAFLHLSTTQLLSVPYAFHAQTVEEDQVDDADADSANELQHLSLSGLTLSLSQSNQSVLLPSSPWLQSGSNIYFNTGKVGIGDNSPLATLTVGNGDKLQLYGSDGDIVFNDDQGSLRFANANGATAPMIELFSSGTNNATRMFVSHSPSFPSWGIEYNDTVDAFTWIGDNIPVLNVNLAGQQRIGIGTRSPESKLHVLANSSTGGGQLKLTESQFDYSRITMNNNIHNNFWDIAARTDTNLANAQFNIYHSNVGDIFSVNARGRIGINDATPSYTMDINGNQNTRIINMYNDLPPTTNTTYNYGLRVNLSQQTNTGFPRLYNVYAISTDNDAYLSYGLYAYASGASSNNYGIYAYAPTSTGYAGYFSGNVYCTGSYLPSDIRLKNNVTSYTDGLEKILALRPTTYLYKSEELKSTMNLPEGKRYGFVAQEVKVILPELTNETFQPYEEDMVTLTGEQGMWFETINYNGFIPLIVSAIQEQQKKIDSLQQQIDELRKLLQK